MEIKAALKKETLFVSFISSLSVLFIVYFFELTHFTLSIDEEFSNNIAHTISMGRWGHALLKSTIFPEPFIPFYTEILSLVILALSCSVISKTLGLNTQQSVFFSILYSALPQFAYQLEFSNQSDTLATAVLLSSVSTYLTLRKKGFLLSIITPVIALTFSVSIYQSIIFLPVSIIASYICYAIANNKSDLTFKNIVFKPVIVMIVAAAAYSLLTKIIQWHFGKSSESYFLNMIGWIHQPANETIKSIVAFIIDYFSFNAPYGLSIYTFSLLFLVVMFVSPIKNRFVFLLSAAAVILSPFLMNVIIGGFLPPRAMNCLAISFAASGVILFTLYAEKKILWAVPVIVLLYGTASSSKLFYTDYLSYNQDYNVSSFIANDIYKYVGTPPDRPVRIYFYGALNVDSVDKPANHDMFGSSFLNWDAGNSARISAFMNATAIAKIIPASFDEIKPEIEKINSAPLWPAKDSVFKINNVVVVKLGSTPGNCINGVSKSTDPTRCL
ncbi:glucosyltransferase domain-containing protein [Pantoea anthophila]|uniref:glucosyltransferase domain-containing protein n=1 Tax=Pantoea anthophila TaxID=470931 RepID=UPI002DBD6E22|nr:glucosyltransferase domain-containing protein [Pantoea anthophila]MEB7537151.1 glucosyltransferase domain-containing protein [Pantoea anthophila]